MNGIETQLVSLRWAHEILAMVTADLTPEQAAWLPPGIANPIGAQYAHAICGEDWIVQSLFLGRAPLYASEWAGRTGISTPQPNATYEWAQSVTMDLSALRSYAAAVAQATESYIIGLSDADLDRSLDMTFVGLGQRTVGWVLSANVIGHINNMAGEISALKGVLGAKGYPF